MQILEGNADSTKGMRHCTRQHTLVNRSATCNSPLSRISGNSPLSIGDAQKTITRIGSFKIQISLENNAIAFMANDTQSGSLENQ